MIYPSHDDFQSAIEQSFNFDDKNTLKLWIIPFDISAGIPEDKRIHWPENCCLKQTNYLEVSNGN